MTVRLERELRDTRRPSQDTAPRAGRPGPQSPPTAGPSPVARRPLRAGLRRAMRRLALALVFGAVLLAAVRWIGGAAQDERGADEPQPRDAASRPAEQTAGAQPDAPFSPHVRRDENGRLAWDRPRIGERQGHRDHMVNTQIAAGGPFHRAVRDPDVIAAMRAVPRHDFVPPARRESAYLDMPLPIGHGQTISQPYIVALMTELLKAKSGDRVLEIGTGSGYQAAVLSELTPYVYTIEIIEPLYKRSKRAFEELGYKTIQARPGDGYEGWREAAPFDGIIVTCAAGHVPPPLWEQLRPGGRMVVPIGGVYDTQRLVVLTKQRDGGRRSENVLPVRFVPMTGKMQRP